MIDIKQPKKMAKGGIATKPTLVEVGDAGTEGIVPLPRGFRQGLGNSTTITIHMPITIHDAHDPRAVALHVRAERLAYDEEDVSHHHISEDDLERMCPGTIELDELARLTDNVLSCAKCAKRLERTREYIHAIQQALKTWEPDRPDSKEAN
jgi:hypothetical protein